MPILSISVCDVLVFTKEQTIMHIFTILTHTHVCWLLVLDNADVPLPKYLLTYMFVRCNMFPFNRFRSKQFKVSQSTFLEHLENSNHGSNRATCLSLVVIVINVVSVALTVLKSKLDSFN